MDEPIKAALKSWGTELTPGQAEALELFRRELLDKNSRFNLVSVSDEPALWPRHILDALAGAELLRRLTPAGGRVADTGAGAGFPGIPLSVALEGLSFDLWDSSLKRQMFLTWTISRLRLGNARALHARVGQSGAGEKGRYDAVVERAMGKLENILPQCLNMLKPGGVFLPWQSAADAAAERDLPALAARCGARGEPGISYRLPGETKDRHILVFRKNA